ncbi:MAG: phosphotransferase [Actinomycetota bacterium]|nr:phosphotransferase [Actinomycetota bacterium]
MEQVPYEQRSRLSQVRAVRAAALAALADYPVEVASLRLLLHGYNTTFRVDTVDRRRFALRVNVTHRKPVAELDAELAWLAALDEDTDLVVPAPVATRDGALRTSTRCDLLDAELPAVLMTWLPGRDLEHPSPDACRELGRVTARLHEHAASWPLPESTSLPTLERVLVDVPDHLTGDHPLLDDDRRAVLTAAMAECQRHYDRLWADGPRQVIHADLHGGNVKWLRGQMAVFDFDDAVVAAPVHDLAISAYYLRDRHELVDALLEGYAEVRTPPPMPTEQFEALVAARNLLLLNDVISAENAELRDLAPTYTANTVTKLRSYLDTGVYRHDVAGLEPLG